MNTVLKCALAPLFVLSGTTGADTALTKEPGDAERGKAVVLDRDRGHCLLCHRIGQLDEGFQGTIGPELSSVGSRLGPQELRERIVDPTRLNPDTVMPAYYRVEGLRQVAKEFRDRPVLTAQEVEDVVAYLSTLRDQPETQP